MFRLSNKKKKDNKGFSLVELVIVIAIMAILVGILAPQYTKYVEKSRKAADASNMDEMVKVVKVFAADPANELPTGYYTIVIGESKTDVKKGKGVVNASLGATEPLYKELDATIPNWTKTTMKSKKWGKKGANKSIQAIINVNEEGGTSVAYITEDDNSETNKFAKYMTSGEAGTTASEAGATAGK